MKANTFFTSDWHLGHQTVLKPSFDNRPFHDLDHMARVLINNYNSCANEKSVGYFLGDMGLCSKDYMEQYIKQLIGTKVLIKGNHDKGGIQKFKDIGFDVVINSASIIIGGELVTMSHCPLPGIVREDTTNMKGYTPGEHWHGEFKHLVYQVPNHGQYHLHGHIHSPNHGKSKKIQDKQYDVGVVANNYRPVSISRLESWIAKTKNA